MKLDDLAQLTAANADLCALKLPDGSTAPFVMLSLSCQHQGRQTALQPVAMSCAAARTLALQLLDVVEKAGPTGGKPPTH